ncbi:hypothetical protein Tco_0730800, partial [Tanacetum coccineum]
MVQLKKLTFEELKKEFEKLMRIIERIVPMRSEETIKRPGIELEQEPSKKQKTVGSEEVPVIQENVEEPVIVKEEEIAKPVKKTRKRHKTVARKRRFTSDEDKEVDYEILDQKSLIIEWKSEYYGLKPMPDKVEVLEEINVNVNWNIVSWKLHNSSGVHTLQTDTDMIIYMLVEKKYPLMKKILLQMLKGLSVAGKCALWFGNLEARNGDEKGSLS